MDHWNALLFATVGVLFIGIAKAGFGGGLGMLTTPLCVLAFGAQGQAPSHTVGVLLPLLCAGDAFSLYHYWKKWQAINLLYLVPGVIAGVFIGVQIVGKFSPRQFNIAIGVLAVSFVTFQLIKGRLFRQEKAFQPGHLTGIPCGIGAGITSTFAHGAGPLISLYVIPQRLPKEIYVGTTVLIFTWINWIKMPFFIHSGMINQETWTQTLAFLPLVPVGVWMGVWLNRKVSEKVFSQVVYLVTFLTGVQLIFKP